MTTPSRHQTTGGITCSLSDAVRCLGPVCSLFLRGSTLSLTEAHCVPCQYQKTRDEKERPYAKVSGVHDASHAIVGSPTSTVSECRPSDYGAG